MERSFSTTTTTTAATAPTTAPTTTPTTTPTTATATTNTKVLDTALKGESVSQKTAEQQQQQQSEKQQQEVKLVNVPIVDEVVALNVMVSFLNLAQRRGVFTIDESAKIWECVKKFQKS